MSLVYHGVNIRLVEMYFLTCLHLRHQPHMSMLLGYPGMGVSSFFSITCIQPLSWTNRRMWSTMGVSHDSLGHLYVSRKQYLGYNGIKGIVLYKYCQ